MSLANDIKTARKAAGLTQKELAEKINKSFSTIQKYEMGLAQPPLNVVKDIAAALHVDPYSIMDFDMAMESMYNYKKLDAVFLDNGYEFKDIEGTDEYLLCIDKNNHKTYKITSLTHANLTNSIEQFIRFGFKEMLKNAEEVTNIT